MDVKFVSYDGKFPNACSGTLILEIDGKTVTFGNTYREPKPDYPSFWCSGGSVSFDDQWNENVTSGPWEFSSYESDMLPDNFKENKDLLLKVFNENVPWGCCGGCV